MPPESTGRWSSWKPSPASRKVLLPQAWYAAPLGEKLAAHECRKGASPVEATPPVEATAILAQHRPSVRPVTKAPPQNSAMVTVCVVQQLEHFST